jgi:hypothetical protein
MFRPANFGSDRAQDSTIAATRKGSSTSSRHGNFPSRCSNRDPKGSTHCKVLIVDFGFAAAGAPHDPRHGEQAMAQQLGGKVGAPSELPVAIRVGRLVAVPRKVNRTGTC